MKVRDPICGMMVDPETAPARAEGPGGPVYFCAEACRAEYARRLRERP